MRNRLLYTIARPRNWPLTIGWAIAFALAMAPAFAADSPSTTYKTATINVDPFAGFFLGAELGYDWSKSNIHNAPFSLTPSGFAFGGNATYRWATPTGVYLGVSQALGWSAGDDSRSILGPIRAKAESRWLGATMAQLGYRIQPNLLAYAEAGWAYGSRKLSVSGAGLNLNDSAIGSGWALGAGLDYALPTPNWLATVEYRHSDLGSSTYTLAKGVKVKADNHDDAILFGVKYRFGG